MLAISRINFTQKSNQKSVRNNVKYSHSQPIQDTVSFKALPDNFGEVISGKLFRGALPCAKKEFEALKTEKGIKFVINLGDEDKYEEEIVKELGMNYSHIDLLGGLFSKSFKNNLKKFAEKVDGLMKEGPVFLHCGIGERRTGLAVGAYQHYKLGLPEEEIFKQGEKYNSEYGLEDLFKYGV